VPQIERIARLFVASGVTKIRLTGARGGIARDAAQTRTRTRLTLAPARRAAGGEPTVRADLEDITARLGALPGLRDLGITSNGLVLAKKLPGALALARTHTSLRR
jgi:cyclic pyranopterin phosphate synthase